MKRPRPRRLGGPVAIRPRPSPVTAATGDLLLGAKTGGSMSGPNWNLAGGTFASSAEAADLVYREKLGLPTRRRFQPGRAGHTDRNGALAICNNSPASFSKYPFNNVMEPCRPGADVTYEIGRTQGRCGAVRLTLPGNDLNKALCRPASPPATATRPHRDTQSGNKLTGGWPTD